MGTFASEGTALEAMVVLASVAIAVPDVWIVTRVLHRRSLGSLVGPLRPALRDAGLATLCVTLTMLAVALLTEPVERTALALDRWFLLGLLALPLIVLQVSAEEFRVPRLPAATARRAFLNRPDVRTVAEHPVRLLALLPRVADGHRLVVHR